VAGFIPPYCSILGVYLVYCFCLFFVCLYVRLQISQWREKDSGVKLCVLVRLLSGMSFSHFDEFWLTWSHGGGITSGMSYIEIAVGQSKLGAAASHESQIPLR